MLIFTKHRKSCSREDIETSLTCVSSASSEDSSLKMKDLGSAPDVTCCTGSGVGHSGALPPDAVPLGATPNCRAVVLPRVGAGACAAAGAAAVAAAAIALAGAGAPSAGAASAVGSAAGAPGTGADPCVGVLSGAPIAAGVLTGILPGAVASGTGGLDRVRPAAGALTGGDGVVPLAPSRKPPGRKAPGCSCTPTGAGSSGSFWVATPLTLHT